MLLRTSKLRSWVVVFVLIVFLATATLAQAGGWAVITLDELPGPQTAGTPFLVGMTALQHGRTPLEIDQLVVQASHESTGQALTFFAKPDGKPGHYSVELMLPEDGQWEWNVSTGMFPLEQPMPVLHVGGGSQSTASAANLASVAASRLAELPVFILLILLASAAGVILMIRSRLRRAPFWLGLGLIILCAGLVFAFFFNLNPATASVPVTADSASTGQQLFIGKGCVVCHINDRAMQNSKELSVNFGPNLTNYRNDADFLKQVLADPKAAGATRVMPNLHLTQAEIDALVAFLNAEED